MIGWLRRRSLPVFVCAFTCAVIALVIAIALPDKYTAEAVVVVPSGGDGGLTPGEASNLATTYANLIPEDRAILQRAATRLGLDAVTVGDNLQVTHDFDTSILRMSYSDTNPTLAMRGSRTVAQSIEGPNPVSPRIAANSISVVALPSTASSDSLEPIQAAIFGFILGLVGGSLIMIAWERADARIRDERTLGLEVGAPGVVAHQRLGAVDRRAPRPVGRPRRDDAAACRPARCNPDRRGRVRPCCAPARPGRAAGTATPGARR